jgi:hypothetical protein
MTIYVDGVQQASKPQTGTIAPSTGVGAMVGNCPSDMPRQFAGALADARIYSRGSPRRRSPRFTPRATPSPPIPIPP